MQGLMQSEQLTTRSILEHAERCYGGQTLISRLEDGSIHQVTWSHIAERTKRLGNALNALGLRQGDIIGTLAWNTFRHVESWYASTGLGLCLHTINPRLSLEQLTYIINHAADKVILVDVDFVPILEQIKDELHSVEHLIIMTDHDQMPHTSFGSALCYEDLLSAASSHICWPDFPEENASALCYTSGTTGNPKGVLYSHRSSVIHAMSVCTPNVMGLGMRSSVLPVVPMFHANAWGIIHAAPMAGAKLVLPGSRMDPASLYELIIHAEVDIAAAVPTIWQMLLNYLEEHNKPVECLQQVMIAGSAVPRKMIETFKKKYDVTVCHAWGMTELSPVGTINHLGTFTDSYPEPEKMAVRCKQGRFIYGVHPKIVDDQGDEQAWDGKSPGHLKVRGPWVAKHYFKLDDQPLTDQEGFLETGDIGTIDEQGYLHITDRAKDLIKSGGEWISSIELENIAMDHPKVNLAAAIAVPDEKWDERPCLVVQPNEHAGLDADDIKAFVAERLAKWQVPDRVVFVEQLPMTATGKVNKMALRETYSELEK